MMMPITLSQPAGTHCGPALYIFQDLPTAQQQRLCQQEFVRKVKPDHLFYMPGDAASTVYLILEGQVQLYRMTLSGKKILITNRSAGDLFGEMAVLEEKERNTFAQAIEKSMVIAMHASKLRALMMQEPKVAMRVMTVMGDRLSNSEKRLEEIAFQSIASRLAALLLQMAEPTPVAPTVCGYTHRDLAEILGTYRETTTQTLNEFKMRGLIAIGRKRIELLNIYALQALVKA